MKQCTFKPATNKLSIRLAEKRNRMLANPEKVNHSVHSVYSNREHHKTYEQRHDDPTGFTFSPRINKNFKFTKDRLFMNSPPTAPKQKLQLKRKSEEVPGVSRTNTKRRALNKDLQVTSLTQMRGKQIPLEMTFQIQMPHKAGMDTEVASYVPIRISQQDGLQQVLRKSLDAAHQFFGGNHHITQDDMDFMVNQVIIKKVEAHTLYQEKSVKPEAPVGV